jgi:hypothetical protein
LPVPQNGLIPILRLPPEWQVPFITQHKAVPRIENRAATFGAKIKGILRQIVFSRGALCRRAGDIE